MKDTYSDVADVSVQAIAVELSNEELPLLTARYALHANQTGDRRPILIDYSMCPLWPISLKGSGAESISYGENARLGLDSEMLRLRSGGAWGAAIEVVVELRWTNSASRPPLINEYFLHLPANLPRIGRPSRDQTGKSIQVPISVDAIHDRRLVSAIAHSLSDEAITDRPLVQAVFGRGNDLRCGDAGRAQICLLGSSAVDLAGDHQQQICATLHGMHDFFSERLKARPALRLAVVVNSSSETKGVSGALLTRPLENFQLPGLHQPAHEFPVARDVASTWWETGCRIEGDGGFHLSAGISFALGLAWTKLHTSEERFYSLVQWYRQRMVPAARFAATEFRPGERLIGIGMVLFEALEKRPALWNTLQELTNDYWGAYAPKDVVLAQLEKGGVPTKDFTRKRFHRD